ncbi:hypothetical protein [Anatilimnocola floriformis]|uniref:hypothetical protein n=1 Tax=Anatilimnocola floriformis TaxID=2948575 RepID=UPI0020C2E9A0|nr:hypothetical protein [Anatilimnocola floriformis]
MLTKEQIRGAQDRPREWVPTESWTPEGETFDKTKHGVWVCTMSGRDRDSWEQDCLNRKGNHVNLRATLAVRVVHDADGKRIFTDADAEWLGEKSPGPLSDIFAVASRLNKLSKDDQDELVKN